MLLEQRMKQVARQRAERKPFVYARLAHGRDFIETPAQLARAVVRRQHETGLLAYGRGMDVEALDQTRVAPILPRQHRGKRSSGAAVPAHDEIGRAPCRGRVWMT